MLKHRWAAGADAIFEGIAGDFAAGGRSCGEISIFIIISPVWISRVRIDGEFSTHSGQSVLVYEEFTTVGPGLR